MSATQRQVKELHDRKTKLIGDKVPDRQVGMAVGWAAGMAGLDCLPWRSLRHCSTALRLRPGRRTLIVYADAEGRGKNRRNRNV